MAAADQASWWQWGITTFIALLAAGGGVAALLGYLRKRRFAVRSRLALNATPMYTGTASGSRLIVRPTDVLGRLQASDATKAAGGINPVISVEITNAGAEQIAVNEIRLVFSLLENRSPREAPATDTANVVVQYRPGDSGAARRTDVEAAFGLLAVSVEGDFVTYSVPAAQADGVAKDLGSREEIAVAFVDVSGSAHAEWAVTETADILLDARRSYTLPVGYTVAAHDALTVRFALGANTEIAGVAAVDALIDSSRRETLGVLDLMLKPPAFVRSLQDRESRGAVVDADPTGS